LNNTVFQLPHLIQIELTELNIGVEQTHKLQRKVIAPEDKGRNSESSVAMSISLADISVVERHIRDAEIRKIRSNTADFSVMSSSTMAMMHRSENNRSDDSETGESFSDDERVDERGDGGEGGSRWTRGTRGTRGSDTFPSSGSGGAEAGTYALKRVGTCICFSMCLLSHTGGVRFLSL
jgi:hypothetical protein